MDFNGVPEPTTPPVGTPAAPIRTFAEPGPGVPAGSLIVDEGVRKYLIVNSDALAAAGVANRKLGKLVRKRPVGRRRVYQRKQYGRRKTYGSYRRKSYRRTYRRRY